MSGVISESSSGSGTVQAESPDSSIPRPLSRGVVEWRARFLESIFRSFAFFVCCGATLLYVPDHVYYLATRVSESLHLASQDESVAVGDDQLCLQLYRKLVKRSGRRERTWLLFSMVIGEHYRYVSFFVLSFVVSCAEMLSCRVNHPLKLLFWRVLYWACMIFLLNLAMDLMIFADEIVLLLPGVPGK